MTNCIDHAENEITRHGAGMFNFQLSRPVISSSYKIVYSLEVYLYLVSFNVGDRSFEIKFT